MRARVSIAATSCDGVLGRPRGLPRAAAAFIPADKQKCPGGRASSPGWLVRLRVSVYTRSMRETHCYRVLLNRASRKVSALYDEALAPLGVSIAQFNLIRVIISMEPVSVTDLAAFVELERSTVGRNGRVLKRLGLVKMSHGSDQREALFSLTEKGHEVLKRGLPLWDSVQHGIEENLGADKARQLQRLLASL